MNHQRIRLGIGLMLELVTEKDHTIYGGRGLTLGQNQRISKIFRIQSFLLNSLCDY